MTETFSEPGRVTWNGVCAHDGCESGVYARRVPNEARPPEVENAQTPPADDEDTVKEVKFDVPQPKRSKPGEPPVREPEPVADDDQHQQSVRADTLAEPVGIGARAEAEPAPGGGGSELVDKRAGRPAQQRPRGVFRHPLDW